MNLVTLLSTFVVSSSACEAVQGPLQAAQDALQAGHAEEALEIADDLVERAPNCIESQLALAAALELRLQDLGGVRALGVSRRMRRAIAAALELDGENVEALRAEIGYLIHAPSVAGGDRSRAAQRIEILGARDRRAAAELALELARAEGEAEQILAALAEYVEFESTNIDLRSEFARRLIIAGEYSRADAELESWAEIGTELLPHQVAERAYLKGGLRVIGGFELEDAETWLLASLVEHSSRTPNSSWPDRANAWAFIGAAREARSDTQGAVEAYRQALAHDPESARARAGLARLDSNSSTR